MGQTKRVPLTRQKEHQSYYRRWVREGRPRSGSHAKLFYAFDKYPPDEWQFEVLRENVSREDIDSAEREFVEKFDSFENGYNMTAGGMGLGKMKLSEEHKQRIRDARNKFYASPEGQRDLEEKRQRFLKDNPSKKGNIPWNVGKRCSAISEGMRNSQKNKDSWTPERREAAAKRLRENNPRKKKASEEA